MQKKKKGLFGFLIALLILSPFAAALAAPGETHLIRTNSTDDGTVTETTTITDGFFNLYGIEAGETSPNGLDGVFKMFKLGSGFAVFDDEGFRRIDIDLDGGTFTAENASFRDALTTWLQETFPILGETGLLAAFDTKQDKIERTFGSTTFAGSTTSTRLSNGRDAQVQYAYDATVSISVLGGQSIEAILEYADNQAMMTNVVRVDSAKTANTGVIGLDQTNTLKVGGVIPAGKYRRVRFVTSGSGVTAPSALASSQEVLE